MEKINKIRGKFSITPPPLLKNNNGELTDDPIETSEIFAEAFTEISSEESYPLSFLKKKRAEERRQIEFRKTQHNQEEPYNQPFTEIEFQNALSSTKEKSPGLDKISYAMIKNAHTSLQKALLSIYNRIFAENVFPVQWKTAAVIPIPKANKDNSIPTNYRPISLTSCLCKLMEKMINLRLSWFLEKEKCFSRVQSGFRQGRSTTDCLVQLSNDIQEAIINKKHTIVVYFDIMKAYDTAWKRGILKRLLEFGLHGNLPIFIKNFLNNRQIKVRVGSTLSNAKSVDEGVPQGSVLSCTLFAIAMDTVVQKLEGTQVKTCLYVDDLTIYASGSFNVAQRQIQMAIRRIEKWSKETGFRFSPMKTVSMHICRHRENGIWCTNNNPEISLYGSPIQFKDTHMYLGLLIDKRLKWDKHIELLRVDCQKRLNILKYLSHVNWGADSKTLIRIYIAFIKSKIEYGVEAYGSACASTLDRLKPLQNASIRIATGAYRTSPTESIEIIAGIKPLDISRAEKMANYMVRITLSSSNPLKTLCQNLSTVDDDVQQQTNKQMEKFILNSIQNRIKIIAEDYDIQYNLIIKETISEDPPWEVNCISACDDVLQNAKKDIPPHIIKMIYTHHIDTHIHSNFTAYTDGSKTEQGVAYAFTASSPNKPPINKSIKMNKETSVFSAELHAIQGALNAGIQAGADRLLIFTDSKSSIQTIVKPFNKNPIAAQIQKTVRESSSKLKLCWVPSHVGIRGNEIADNLANRATNLPIEEENKLTRDEYKSKIKKKSKEIWLNRWKSPRQRPNKLREITDNISPLPNSVCQDRRWERTLTRLRIGHSRLTHEHLMTATAPPTCENCGEEVQVTIKHILIECPQYRTKRLRAFGSANLTLKHILNNGDTSVGGSLYKFLQNINILNLI